MPTGRATDAPGSGSLTAFTRTQSYALRQPVGQWGRDPKA